MFAASTYPPGRRAVLAVALSAQTRRIADLFPLAWGRHPQASSRISAFAVVSAGASVAEPALLQRGANLLLQRRVRLRLHVLLPLAECCAPSPARLAANPGALPAAAAAAPAQVAVAPPAAAARDAAGQQPMPHRWHPSRVTEAEREPKASSLEAGILPPWRYLATGPAAAALALAAAEAAALAWLRQRNQRTSACQASLRNPTPRAYRAGCLPLSAWRRPPLLASRRPLHPLPSAWRLHSPSVWRLPLPSAWRLHQISAWPPRLASAFETSKAFAC